MRLSQLFQEKLLVVVEHVQAALQVAEEHRHCLDPLLVLQVLEPFLSNRLDWNAVLPLFLGAQIQLFQLVVGKL